LEVFRGGKEFGVEYCSQAGGNLIGHQRLIAGIGPVDAVQFLLGPGQEGVQTTLDLQHPFQFRHFEVFRIAGPLQHLEVQDRGDVFHGCSGQHLAGQIEEDDRSIIGGGHLIEEIAGGGGSELILEEFEKAVATDHHRPVQGKSQILGEGTLAGPVETGNPDADFMTAAALLGHLHFL